MKRLSVLIVLIPVSFGCAPRRCILVEPACHGYCYPTYHVVEVCTARPAPRGVRYVTVCP